MLGFILLIVSTILKIALSPLLYIFGMIVSLVRGEFNAWNTNLAVAKDQYGNTLGKYVFNLMLIKRMAINLVHTMKQFQVV